MKEMKIPNSLVIAIAIFATISGATACLFIRYGTAPTLVLAAYRKTIVTVMLLPFVLLRYRNELRQISLRTFFWCMLGGVFLGLHFFTYFLSVKYTTIAASNVLTGTEILFVSLFMALTGKERFHRISRLCIAAALIGSVLISISSAESTALNAPFGNVCGIICAIMLGGYSLIGSKIRSDLSNTTFTFLSYGSSAVVLNILVLFSEYRFFGYGSINFLVAVGMAVFCSLLCHSLYTWTLKYISPTLLAIIKNFAPVFTSILGVLFLSEIPSISQIIGGLIVVAAIMLFTLYPSKAVTPKT